MSIYHRRSLFFILVPFVCYGIYSVINSPPSSPLLAHEYISEAHIWPIDPIEATERRTQGRRLSAEVLKSQGVRARLKDNLRDDRDFVTTMLGAGWNNQIIQILNLIYLGVLSERTPILPPFRLVNLQSNDSVPVSDIFNLRRLSGVLDEMPLVEMHELKHSIGLPPRLQSIVYDGEVPQSGKVGTRFVKGDLIPMEEPEDEVLGCWSMAESKGEEAGKSGRFIMNMDTPWTPLPRSCYKWEEDPGRPSFHDVANLIRGRREHHVPEESKSIISTYNLPQPSVDPDQHVACIDSTFGFSDQFTRYDVGNELRVGLGMWASVGQHLHFRDEIQQVRDGYIRATLDLKSDVPIPDYVAVHIRRGDFQTDFLELTPRQYAHATSNVIQTLQDSLDVHVQHIIFTTDETDPAWIGQLYDYGWRYVNHTELQTVERYGGWFPVILDSAILSAGKGFLGGVYSTMSLLAYRRTIEWNFGIGRLIGPGHVVPDGWEWPWHLL